MPETISIDRICWKTLNQKAVSCDIARLDKIHPVISGNKIFKLKYNLEEAVRLQKGILTMGGAYSNHLAATAYACRQAGIPAIGIIRGEIVLPLNSTLQFCVENEMKLISVERMDFDANSKIVEELKQTYQGYFFVPEGGSNEEGEKGCTEILSLIKGVNKYSQIVCAIGTGTTFRGISKSALQDQTLIGISVLKIRNEEQERFIQNHLSVETKASLKIFFEYAGKGYAQKEEILFSFMNRFYKETNVPLDFVYTGKLMMAVSNLFENRIFSDTDHVLVMHTGGLQGNQSLTKNELQY